MWIAMATTQLSLIILQTTNMTRLACIDCPIRTNDFVYKQYYPFIFYIIVDHAVFRLIM